jgi:hypothetical protein
MANSSDASEYQATFDLITKEMGHAIHQVSSEKDEKIEQLTGQVLWLTALCE